MRKKISSIFLIIMIITSSIAYGEIGIEDELRSYILADVATGQVLEEYNADDLIEIASISKLMTYLVVMDEVSSQKISLDDKIIIDEDVASVNGSSLELEVGEIFTVKGLLEGSLIVSANDGTYALAKYIGGTEENFAKMMNEKANEIGLDNAKFYNASGLPVAEKDVQNSMTTKEIFKLSKYILEKYPEIIKITKIPSLEINNRNYFEENTNPLLNKIKEVDGLKTGFTDKAGYCNVSTFNIQGEENITKDLRLVAIVMGTSEHEVRDRLSKIVVEYGIDNYSNKMFFQKNTNIGKMDLPKGEKVEVEIYPKEEFSRLIKNDEEVKVEVELNDKISLPINKGSKVGRAIIEKEGERIFETDVIVNEDIQRANWFEIIRRSISNFYNKIVKKL